MIRVLVFIAFLAAYGLLLWASNMYTSRLAKEVSTAKTFKYSVANVLIGAVWLFGFVFILSGYFNARLVAAYVGAIVIGAILAVTLQGFLGDKARMTPVEGAWEGADFGAKHKPVMVSTYLFLALVIVAYPVIIGRAYFTVQTDNLPVIVLRYTVSAMFALFVVGLIFWVGVVVSKNTNENVRNGYLVGQLTGLLSNALLLALLFWSLDLGRASQQVNIAGLPLTFSPVLFAILVTYFLLAVLIPFIVGAQRAKQWRTVLLEKRRDWAVALEEILENPVEATYLPSLSSLQDRLSREAAQFIESDKLISIFARQGGSPTAEASSMVGAADTRAGSGGLRYSLGKLRQFSGEVAGVAPEQRELLASAYKWAQDHDSRLQHLDLLQQFSQRVGEIRTDLMKHSSPRALEKGAKDWLAYLSPRKEGLSQELAEVAKTRTPALVIWGLFLSPIMSVLLSEFGKWLWTYFSKSLPQ